MKKQHGVVFQAPSCPQHGLEMQLHRMAWWVGQSTHVEYMWACQLDSVETSCGVFDATWTGELSVPLAVLNQYGDPGPKFVGGPETPVRLHPEDPCIKALFGGGGPSVLTTGSTLTAAPGRSGVTENDLAQPQVNPDR
jgi:hypothetical protein